MHSPETLERAALLMVDLAERLYQQAADHQGVPVDLVKAHFRAELAPTDDGEHVYSLRLTPRTRAPIEWSRIRRPQR